MLVEQGWRESRSKPLGDKSRHPWLSNTGVTVGGGGDLSGFEPFLYTLELPVYIQSSRRRKRK